MPQPGIHDYDGDSDLEFYTYGRIGTDNDFGYAQYRRWDAQNFEVECEYHVFANIAGAAIKPSGLVWSDARNAFVTVGTATGDLFPSATYPGTVGTKKPFLSVLPSDSSCNSPTPVPINDTAFFTLPLDFDSKDMAIKGFALPPVVTPGDPLTGYLAFKASDESEAFGSLMTFSSNGTTSLTNRLKFGNAIPKSLHVNRSFNLVGAFEIFQNPLTDEARLGTFLEIDAMTFATIRQEPFGSYSTENRVRGSQMGVFGHNAFVFGRTANFPVTNGSTEILGPSDAWVGHVETLGLAPDAIVTAGQFRWAPLVPYGIYTVFYQWPRIPELQILGPVDGAYPDMAQHLQILVNDKPSAFTALNGYQANFIAPSDVNGQPTASVQLIYDDGDVRFESNTVTMPTADHWVGLFESNGYAASIHSNGAMGPGNPLRQDDTLVTFFAGGGSLGDDSIGADELTPGDKAFTFLGAPPEVKAKVGNQEFDVSFDYFGNSPGSTPGLGQGNLRFSQDFWVFCAAQGNVEFTLTVTDTATGSLQTYTNPLGQVAQAVTDTQAFATCP